MKKIFLIVALMAASSIAYAKDYIVTVDKSELTNVLAGWQNFEDYACFKEECYFFIDNISLNGILERLGDVKYFKNSVVNLANSVKEFENQWSLTEPVFELNKAKAVLARNELDRSQIAVIIDTGMIFHKNIFGDDNDYNLLAEINGNYCYNFNGADPYNGCIDFVGHGTEVAGVIASAGGANEIYGSSFGAGRIYSIGVASAMSYILSYDAIIKALEHVYNLKTLHNYPIAVVNMSFGDDVMPYLDEIIDNLYEAGILLVAAAENDSKIAGIYPAVNEKVIGVTNLNDSLNIINKYHSEADLAAPGYEICSTTKESMQIFSLDRYNDFNFKFNEDWSYLPDNERLMGVNLSLDSSNFSYIVSREIDISKEDVDIEKLENMADKYAFLMFHSESENCEINFSIFNNNEIISETKKCNAHDNFFRVDLSSYITSIPFNISIGIKGEADSYLYVSKFILEGVNYDAFNCELKGSSFASPFVAGALLAAKSLYPEASPELLKQLLFKTSSKNLVDKKKAKYGVINVGKFLEAVEAEKIGRTTDNKGIKSSTETNIYKFLSILLMPLIIFLYLKRKKTG